MRSFTCSAAFGLALLGCHRGAGPADPEPPPSRADAPTSPDRELATASAPSQPDSTPPTTETPEDVCTMAGLQAAVDGSAPWTTEGPRCFDVFAAACEAGTADACSWAALTAFERLGGASLDVPRVHALLGKGCELGSADGCRNVGALHLRGELGDDGPAAQAAARPWFDKACALGHAQACEEAESLAPKLVQVQGANLKAGSMSVDGFEVRELACALDEVRRDLARTADAGEKKSLKGTRYALHKRDWNLTPLERGKLEDLEAFNKPLFRAYLLKEMIVAALDRRQPNVARDKITQWLAPAHDVARSRQPTPSDPRPCVQNSAFSGGDQHSDGVHATSA